MADPDPTTSPVVATPAPLPAPSAPVAGWRTSEAWVSFLTIVLGALPSSGLIADAPLLAKIVGMAIAALTSLNYTAQRTALKRAYAIGAAPLAQVSRVSQLAASTAVVALVLVLGIGQTACSSTAACKDPKTAASVGCVIEGAVVDCTGVSSLPSAIAVVEPIVGKLIESATLADGTIAWAAIEPSLVDLALQYGTCVIAEIWNKYTTGTPPSDGSGSAVGNRLVRVRPSPTDLAAEFDRIRAKVAPGRKFKTAGATL